MSTEPRASISVDDAGVSEVSPTGKTMQHVRWDEVEEIAAWKVDLYSYDVIRIGVRPTELRGSLTFDEEQDAWETFLNMLNQRFTLQPPDWWSAVAFPAFQQNLTILWRR